MLDGIEPFDDKTLTVNLASLETRTGDYKLLTDTTRPSEMDTC